MKIKKILFIIGCVPAISYSAGFDNLAFFQSIEECLAPVIDCLKGITQKNILVGTFHNQTEASIIFYATIGCYHHVTKKKYLLDANFTQTIEPGGICVAYYPVNRLFDTLLQKELYPETILFKQEGGDQWIAFPDTTQPKNKHIVFKETQP